MQGRKNPVQAKITIYTVTVISLILGIVLYDGLQQVNWLTLLILIFLKIYLTESKVTVTDSSYICLRSSITLPLIYLTGTTASMVVAAFIGVYDGIRYKINWQIAMFNAAQFSLATLAGSLSLNYANELLGGSIVGLFAAAIIATVIYFFVNTTFVCLLTSFWEDKSWWAQFKEFFKVSGYSNWSTGFIGVIYMFFVQEYGLWGLLAFSALLINLTQLLNAALQVSVERKHRKKLEEELLIDKMTGAFNFRYMNEWLSNPSDQHISILFMDIDDFAVFNDMHGHAEGDRVLKLLVNTIKNSIRSNDQVIRYGGDEFVVFLEDLDEVGAKIVAERIAENLRVLRDPKWGQPITVSLGISTIPSDTHDKRQLLLFADQAMYQAKESGKNQIKMWSSIESSA